VRKEATHLRGSRGGFEAKGDVLPRKTARAGPEANGAPPRLPEGNPSLSVR
jgi:hypothetical protein